MTPGTSISIDTEHQVEAQAQKYSPSDLAWAAKFKTAWRALSQDGIDKHDYPWPIGAKVKIKPEPKGKTAMGNVDAAPATTTPPETKQCQCGRTITRDPGVPYQAWNRKKWCSDCAKLTSVQKRAKGYKIETVSNSQIVKDVKKDLEREISTAQAVFEPDPVPTPEPSTETVKNSPNFERRFCTLPGCNAEIPVGPTDNPGNYAARRYCCVEHAKRGKLLSNKRRKAQAQENIKPPPLSAISVDPADIARSVWEIQAPVVAAMDWEVRVIDKVQAIVNQAVLIGVNQCLAEVRR
jgi:hypothetical protein